MKKIFIISALFIFCVSATHAQFVYPNDICSGAIQLTVSNNSRVQDTLWLDDEFADPAFNSIPYCNGSTTSVRRDLWYKFTATDTALSLITTFFPSQAGVIMYQLFAGDCNNLTSVTCYGNSILTNPNSRRLGGLTIGQQYYLRSFYPNGIGNDASNFSVNIVAKPSNDECAGAPLLPVMDANANQGLGLLYTNDMSTPSATICNGTASTWFTNMKDVWYKFIATATTHVVFIQTTGGGSKGIVYREAGGVFTGIGTFDFFSYAETETLTNLVPGNTYYIRMGAPGIVQFTIGVFENAPPNDNCVNADTVLMSSSFACEKNFTVSKRLVATNSTGGCTSTTFAKDVWFIFRATATSITARVTQGSSVRMGLLQGTCNSLSCLQTSTTEQLSQSGLIVGNYYYLQVGGSNEQEPMAICISPGITNDECNGTIPIAVNPHGQLRKNVIYTGNATQSMPRCSGSGTALDVWYRFTATDTTHLVTIEGAEFFEVLSGSCGALTPFYCGGSAPQPSTAIERTEKVTGLVPGVFYYLRLYKNNTGSEVMATIDVNELPANNECTSAKLLLTQKTLEYEPVVNNGILHATQSMAPCSTANHTNDIWFKFVAPSGSATVISHIVNPLGTTSLYTLGMQLYSGGCGSLTSMACIPQGPTLAHRAQNFSNLVAGNTYYIRQYGNITENTISIIEPPANDDITGAIQLSPSPSAVQTIPSYSCHAASKKFGKICTSSSVTMEHDTWFYFVAEAAAHSITTGNSNSYWDEDATASYRLEAFRGFAADSISLVPKLITCGTNSLSLSGLTIGDTVYIRVGSMGAGLTNIFTIKVSNTLSMDEPAGAALLSKKDMYEYKINTTGATQSMPAGCLIADFPDDDVWFKFIASSDVKRIVAGMESHNITMQLFSGTPGSLTPLLCSNNIMVLPASLTSGNLYYLRAYTKVNTQRGDFRIGLFGEADLYANACNQPKATLGPNLVKNPQFENEEPLLVPNISSGYGYAGKKLANGWWSPTAATSDNWSGDHPIGGLGNIPATAGYGKKKLPRNGKSMLGMVNSSLGGRWSEYVTGKLTQPLTKGKTYFVSFYITFAEEYPNEVFKIGALLSNDSIYNNLGTEALDITPHVGIVPGTRIDAKTKWYNVCGYMYADEAYSYITIGNFGNPAIYSAGLLNTCMFVDDVVVAETILPVLPLRLLDFNGSMNAQQQSELKWQTANENNTKHFEVEWRTDRTAYSKIGTVQAAGNSTTDKYYNFLHTTPAAGNNYYRLKMLDIDGRFTYSPIVKTGLTKVNKLNVHPNPVSSTLNITAAVEKDEMVYFKIVGPDGKTVAAQYRLLQKGSNAFSWDVSFFAAGNYFLVSTSNALTPVAVIKR
jgi:hypothetical protein